MRQDGNTTDGVRSSALWGKRSSGSRSSALWGKGGRGIATVLSLAVALTMPAAGLAGKDAAKRGTGKRATADGLEAHAKPFVAPDLLAQAKKSPKRQFDVIVQGTLGESSRKVEGRVKGVGGGVKKRFRSVTGVAARVPGSAILGLAKNPHVLSVTRDARVKLASYSSNQQWPYVMELSKFWDGINRSGLRAPTIAIVDSGIEKSRSDFGGRVVADVTMTSLAPNSPGDGRGHGTFVAGIAAGEQSNYTGGAPNAKIVSIDVMNNSGMAMTSDVIAAADWILRNKNTYGIRIANFSLHAGVASSFMFDPLDKAVEKLWFNGVVVVASSGNYGVNGQPSGVPTPPGNDPFIITVGAADTGGTMGLSDDVAAPWSAYGYTLDGFAKPDVGAPGRYIVGPVPATSTLVAERPLNLVSGGYMQLSGTSFSAPAVAAAAAYVLAVNPTWTPDQVKGALMVSAASPPNAAPLSVGVGEVKAAKAASVLAPPNPNLALNRFLTMDASGAPGPVFDAASWASTALTDASWASASWASASWASASWSTASWASASWASASWASASWASAAFADASWASASWASASWASASWADNAIGDRLASGGYYISAADRALLGLK